jgi:hypothetical protein
MTRDRSLGIWLIVLFGIPGMVILMLAWLWPTLASERITAIFAGSTGLLVALTQVLMLKRSPDRTDNEPTMIKVEAENRS